MKQKIKKRLNQQRRKNRDVAAMRQANAYDKLANVPDKLADSDYRNHISPLCHVVDEEV